MPNAAVYTASKHFVRAFAESLRAQLAGTRIAVSEAAPGPVESELDKVAGIEGGATPGQGAGASVGRSVADFRSFRGAGDPTLRRGRAGSGPSAAQHLIWARFSAENLMQQPAGR
jgi:short-subunit dehydrogenase